MKNFFKMFMMLLAMQLLGAVVWAEDRCESQTGKTDKVLPGEADPQQGDGKAGSTEKQSQQQQQTPAAPKK